MYLTCQFLGKSFVGRDSIEARDWSSHRPITFKQLSAVLQQRIAQYDTTSDTRQISDKEIKSESTVINQGSVINANHVIGRLGPAVAQLDLDHSFGLLVLSDDHLQVRSVQHSHHTHGIIGWKRVKLCVYSRQCLHLPGSVAVRNHAAHQWNFTAGLGDAPMRLHWHGMLQSSSWHVSFWSWHALYSQNGVGDSADSYAFDGKRIKKWNMREWDYGEKWKIGA